MLWVKHTPPSLTTETISRTMSFDCPFDSPFRTLTADIKSTNRWSFQKDEHT